MSARPRYETLPTKGARSWAGQITRGAAELGTPFMPWQRKVGRLIGELRPPTPEELDQWGPEVIGDGLPRFDLIIVSVPRQSGKTTIAKASTKAKAERHPGAALFGTAQSRIYAVKHLESLALNLGPRVKSRLGVGAERILWPNGSRYEVIAPNESGGHGDSIDWMLIDEGWRLESHTLGGIRPAMAARPHAQMLIISTMGTVDSDVWNSLVQLGRESVDDPESTTAYVEYSAPDEDAVLDPSRWVEWMPALGRTLRPGAIVADMKILPPSDFVRAYGNLTVASLSIVFPEEWVTKAWRVAIPPADRIVLALDVNDEPSGATITGAHLLDGGVQALRTMEWRHGSPNWVLGSIEKIMERRSVEAVAADFGGPARQLHSELVALCERRGISLVDRKPRELGGDTAGFHDALREGSVVIERNEQLESAIRGAARKNLGDLWVPNRRRMMVDASPIISAVIAYGVSREFAAAPRLPAIW